MEGARTTDPGVGDGQGRLEAGRGNGGGFGPSCLGGLGVMAGGS